MPSADGRAALHWSYPSAWPPAPTATPPSMRSNPFKRTRSMTDDCDDDYSEESSKEQCSSPGEADSCQMLSRKKRRGIIEKRRRDRINTSLSDLRRLVPAACEKQGSAKLEKAEILQMTVDYLKMLHTKGHSAMACDPSKFAMDYHNIGFQECITEVAKQLSVEGLDLHDPLRMRLMSHLQSVVAQREYAAKQSPWYPSSAPPPPPPPPNASQLYQSCSPLSPHMPRPPPPPPPSLALPPGALSSYHNASLNTSSSSLEMNSSNSLNTSGSHSHSLNSSYENSGNNSGAGGAAGGSCESTPQTSTQSSTSSANTTIRPLTTISSTAEGYNYLHHNVHQHTSMELYHHSQHLHQQHPYGQSSADPSVSQQMKQPYRPWGTECAY